MSPDDRLAGYYAQRAPSYDRVYHKPERQADLRRIEAWLPPAFTGREVLELACGTGWWTVHGARRARGWLATDTNPQMLAQARGKPLPACVRLGIADAWTLVGIDAEASFDAAFAGFWWSHVPMARLPGWLSTLHSRLLPGARVVMLDNRFVAGSSTPIAYRDDAGDSWQLRTLDDGSRHAVLKNFPGRDDALAALGAQIRDAEWIALDHYWLLSYRLA